MTLATRLSRSSILRLQAIPSRKTVNQNKTKELLGMAYCSMFLRVFCTQHSTSFVRFVKLPYRSKMNCNCRSKLLKTDLYQRLEAFKF